MLTNQSILATKSQIHIKNIVKTILRIENLKRGDSDHDQFPW